MAEEKMSASLVDDETEEVGVSVTDVQEKGDDVDDDVDGYLRHEGHAYYGYTVGFLR